jgi:hypothetical protein
MSLGKTPEPVDDALVCCCVDLMAAMSQVESPNPSRFLCRRDKTKPLSAPEAVCAVTSHTASGADSALVLSSGLHFPAHCVAGSSVLTGLAYSKNAAVQLPFCDEDVHCWLGNGPCRRNHNGAHGSRDCVLRCCRCNFTPVADCSYMLDEQILKLDPAQAVVWQTDIAEAVAAVGCLAWITTCKSMTRWYMAAVSCATVQWLA